MELNENLWKHYVFAAFSMKTFETTMFLQLFQCRVPGASVPAGVLKQVPGASVSAGVLSENLWKHNVFAAFSMKTDENTMVLQLFQ